jgi:hypothetical protein
MQLPTQKTPPKSNLQDYIMLLYGAPKVGKTTFASQFDNALFLATEAGLNALEAYEVPVQKWEDFLEACAEIAKGQHQFKTIIIDTVDNLIKFCSDYVCKQNKITHESELDYGKGYALVKQEFSRAITKLSLLPYGLVFISHEKLEEQKTRTMSLTKAFPTVPNSYRQMILGMADMILYARTIQEKANDGRVVERRVVHTKASENYEAGDRTGKLPETMVFAYASFIEEWKKATKGDSK